MHAPVAQDQEFAIDGAVVPECVHKVGEAFGDVFAGARIKPCRARAFAVRAGDGLDADAVPFPFRHEIRSVECRKVGVLDRVRQHRRAERRWVADHRPLGAAFEPGEQFGIGRR